MNKSNVFLKFRQGGFSPETLMKALFYRELSKSTYHTRMNKYLYDNIKFYKYTK